MKLLKVLYEGTHGSIILYVFGLSTHPYFCPILVNTISLESLKGISLKLWKTSSQTQWWAKDNEVGAATAAAGIKRSLKKLSSGICGGGYMVNINGGNSHFWFKMLWVRPTNLWSVTFVTEAKFNFISDHILDYGDALSD